MNHNRHYTTARRATTLRDTGTGKPRMEHARRQGVVGMRRIIQNVNVNATPCSATAIHGHVPTLRRQLNGSVQTVIRSGNGTVSAVSIKQMSAARGVTLRAREKK